LDDKNELTINHDHVVAVQEEEDCEEFSVEDKVEGSTDDNEVAWAEDLEAVSSDKYIGFAFTQKDVLCSIQEKRAYQVAASYFIANQLLTCSAIQNS